jgi:hypothetical protein
LPESVECLVNGIDQIPDGKIYGSSTGGFGVAAGEADRGVEAAARFIHALLAALIGEAVLFERQVGLKALLDIALQRRFCTKQQGKEEEEKDAQTSDQESLEHNVTPCPIYIL